MKLKILLMATLLLFNTQAFAEGFGSGYNYTDGGLIYTNVTLPLSASKFKENNIVNVSNLNYSSLRQGKSSKINILKLVEIGDAGIMAAAKDGNIKKIHYVETKKQKVYVPLLFIPIYVDKLETTVYGE